VTNRYVPTKDIRGALSGRATTIIDGLRIPWNSAGRNHHIRCPYPNHDDRHPSWRWDGTKERAFCTCSPKGDDALGVLSKVRGIDFAEAKLTAAEILGQTDLIRTAIGGERPGNKGTVVATYNYRGAEGTLRYQVVRLAPKSFFQRRPNGAEDSFINNMDGVEPLPYRLPELIENRDSTVFICEGEKDVDNVADLGLVATCNHGGAGKWRPEISRWFGGRDVVLLPHNDEPGQNHMRDAAKKLKPFASRVRILELPGLKHKGDISDWIEAGGTREQLEALAEDAPVFRLEAKQAPAPERRSIRITAGFLHKNADEGLAAMATAGVGFYQRDKKLVRVCLIKAKNCDGEDILVPGVVPVSSAIIRRSLGQSARWEKSNAKGEVIQIDPPRDVVDQIAGMVGEWPFPPLSGIIATPTLRPDGSLLDRQGYDPRTGLVLQFGNLNMPKIPDHPGKDDADFALGILDELLNQFPFVDDASRTAALSMLLTPVLRAALVPAVPMHLISKPKPGTGASYLIDIAATIATGERAPVMSMSAELKETESRLISAVLAGSPIISLDNCSGTLTGDLLCQATERPLLLLRPLGKSEVVRVPNTFSVFANGNNVVVADDMVRRTLCITLDANMENPEDREFKVNPLAIVQADRGKYVGACLTIGRAYILAGRPDRPRPLPSFERWSDIVRGALIWLGRADPVDTVATARLDDPELQQRGAVFAAWASELALGTGYLTSDLIEAALANVNGVWIRPQLRGALIAVAPSRVGGEPISPTRLGKWLSRTKNVIALGYKLSVDSHNLARPRWHLYRP
jgi:putative DNA primase/helicase